MFGCSLLPPVSIPSDTRVPFVPKIHEVRFLAPAPGCGLVRRDAFNVKVSHVCPCELQRHPLRETLHSTSSSPPPPPEHMLSTIVRHFLFSLTLTPPHPPHFSVTPGRYPSSWRQPFPTHGVALTPSGRRRYNPSKCFCFASFPSSLSGRDRETEK